MEIKVDKDRCSGHARCFVVAPDVYELDDLGFCAITTVTVSPGLEQAAREGAESCPERAITIIE